MLIHHHSHPRRLGHEIITLAHYIKQQGFDFQAENITKTQGRCIGYLLKNQGEDIFQKDIEEQFRIRRSTATGILQLMEKNELLVREPVPYDARLKKLVLTPQAICIGQRVREKIDQMEKKLSSGLTEEELDTLFLLFDKMKKNLE